MKKVNVSPFVGDDADSKKDKQLLRFFKIYPK